MPEVFMKKSSAFRRSLLALMMLIILAVSVLSANVLVVRARKRVEAGAKIVKKLRLLGLEHFYSPGPEIQWYLIKSRKDSIGWLATFHQRLPNGDFIGVKVENIPRVYKSYERWSLNNDATEGQYTSRIVWESGKYLDVSITLSDGIVRVSRRGRTLFKPEIAKAPAKENYLPEGTHLLAVREVAKSKVDAQFAMVFNEQPNFGGVVQFGTVRIKYMNQRKIKGGKVIRVKETATLLNEKISHIYEMDEKGKIIQVRLPENKRIEACDEKTVLLNFPAAKSYFHRFLPRRLERGLEDEDQEDIPIIRLIRSLLSM